MQWDVLFNLMGQLVKEQLEDATIFLVNEGAVHNFGIVIIFWQISLAAC